MSLPGQIHHPHRIGTAPNSHLIGVEENGKPYIPTGVELIQAHWFVRHGERSPVRARMAGHAEIPSVYNLCAMGKQFRTSLTTLAPSPSGLHSFAGDRSDKHAVQSADESNGLKLGKKELLFERHMQVHGQGNVPVDAGPAACYWGELTDIGRLSTLDVGARLRALYVDKLNFLPSVLPDFSIKDHPVTLRSTDMPRTIASLHQIVEGLFPEKEGKVVFAARTFLDENMYSNPLCRKWKRLDRASIAKACIEQNPKLEALDPILSKYIGNKPIRMDGSPAVSGMVDTVAACRAHGIAVPPEFDDPEIFKVLEETVVHEWFDGFKDVQFARLATGRLLGDLGESLRNKVEGKANPIKLALYACHDTTLGGILNCLQVYDGKWPPFTSHISFELFRSAPSPSFFSFFQPSSHYVRLRYNGRSMKIPQCQAPGKHLAGSEGEVCTWDAFKEAVNRVAITGAQWESECAS